MCVCAQLCLTLGDPNDYSPQGSSMRFSNQEYWNGLPFPPPEDLPISGVEPEVFCLCYVPVDFLRVDFGS